MSKQYNKAEKRGRRLAYIKRKKASTKAGTKAKAAAPKEEKAPKAEATA